MNPGDLILDIIRAAAYNAILLFAEDDPERCAVCQEIFSLANGAIIGKQEEPEPTGPHPLIQGFRELPPAVTDSFQGRLAQIHDLVWDHNTLADIAANLNVGLGQQGMSIDELILKMEAGLREHTPSRDGK